MNKKRRFSFVVLLGLLAVSYFCAVISPGVAFANDSFIYTVSEGDCLWLIADKFGVTVDTIKAANSLESSDLQIGQDMLIPGEGTYYQPVSRGAVSRPNPPQTTARESVTPGELVSWPVADEMLPLGSTAAIQDYRSGRKFRIYRLFGANHADCEPVTAEDSRIMKECFGGWSWARRPTVIWLDGRPVACSMAGMPHGDSQDIYNNDFEGHFDLHFLNSRTHGSNRVDEDHQDAVHEAEGGK